MRPQSESDNESADDDYVPGEDDFDIDDSESELDEDDLDSDFDSEDLGLSEGDSVSEEEPSMIVEEHRNEEVQVEDGECCISVCLKYSY